MGTTDNPNDPEINEVNPETGQNKKYLVLSEVERALGFVRPVRVSYTHTKCGVVTTMSRTLAETYATKPDFYTHTFCTYCKDHLPVSEFVWTGTDLIVGS